MVEEKPTDGLAQVGSTIEAFDRVRRNRGGKPGGIDGIIAKEFGKHLRADLCQIHDEVKSGTYTPQAVKRAYIDKEDRGKRVDIIIGK
jgi:retron-type reverse transcriptase